MELKSILKYIKIMKIRETGSEVYLQNIFTQLNSV